MRVLTLSQLFRRIAVSTEKHVPEEPVVVEETLVEEVSIDGMCGVY